MASTQIGAAEKVGIEQVKVLGISGVGGAIELYEFTVFILLTPYISQTLLPASTPEWLRTLQTLAIFALGYLVRPLGGIFIAMLGDAVGRKRTFALTIFLMAVPTLLIGLLPTYDQIGVLAPILLLLCRLFQGLALGGEIPGATVFVAEHVPTQRLGLSCSLVGAGLVLGVFVGAFTVSILTASLGPQKMVAYGWRLVFLIGGVFGLLAAYVRHYVRETPVFQMMQERGQVASRASLGTLLQNFKGQLVAGLALSFMATAVPSVLLLYPAIYMRTALRFDPVVVQNAQTVASIAAAVGSVAGGWLTDALGAIRTYLLYAVAMVIVSYLLFMRIQASQNYLSLWYALVGFFGGIGGLGYFFLVQGFPPQVRLTGVAIPYNISSALGGSLPILVASLMPHNTLAPAHIMLCLAVCTVTGASYLYAKRRPIGFDA